MWQELHTEYWHLVGSIPIYISADFSLAIFPQLLAETPISPFY
jgi:hypothetical protein